MQFEQQRAYEMLVHKLVACLMTRRPSLLSQYYKPEQVQPPYDIGAIAAAHQLGLPEQYVAYAVDTLVAQDCCIFAIIDFLHAASVYNRIATAVARQTTLKELKNLCILASVAADTVVE